METKARFTISNKDGPDPGNFADFQVTVNDPRVICTANCSAGQIALGTPQEATITTAPGVFFNEQATVQVTVTVSNCTCGGGASHSMPLTILATQQIAEVNGLVLDLLTGAPIPAAKVVLEDSVGTKWEDAGTDDTGYFVYTSTPEKKIAAGNLKITVTREGFTEAFKDIPRGQPVTNLRIPMSPSGSVGPSTSAPPITPSLDGTGPVETAPTTKPAEGMSTTMLVALILGGLLMLLGIGAIVLLVVRRGNDDGGPPRPGRGGPGGPGGRPGPGRGGPPPGAPRRAGPPDRTTPMRPGYGPPRPGAPGGGQTTISRSPLADNPTQTRPRSPQPPPFGGPGQPGYPPQPGPGYGPPTQSYPQQAGYGQTGQHTGYQQYGADQRQPDPRQTGRQPAYGSDPYPSESPRPRSEGRRVDWMD
jgi:hypothetical protein